MIATPLVLGPLLVPWLGGMAEDFFASVPVGFVVVVFCGACVDGIVGFFSAVSLVGEGAIFSAGATFSVFLGVSFCFSFISDFFWISGAVSRSFCVFPEYAWCVGCCAVWAGAGAARVIGWVGADC